MPILKMRRTCIIKKQKIHQKNLKEKRNQGKKFKTLYFPGIGVCINLKNANMNCYRADHPGDSFDDRKFFTKSSECKATLGIGFWGVINVSIMQIKNILVELVFPDEDVHNHSLDEFSISASDTYPKLKAFIEKCVTNGMGHHNTFIQVRKYSREVLVPDIEKNIGMKIGLADTRFYPTRRTVYIYWVYASGGSIKACEDQKKILELLTKTVATDSSGIDLYYNFEAFDPHLLSKCYGITLDKTFEELLLSKDVVGNDIMRADAEPQLLPVLLDDYFDNTEEHLRPKKNSSAQQRYDTAVKLLISDCAKKNVRIKANLGTRQQTGAFYLFLQTQDMVDLYRHFGHDSIIFMDSGFRVNRNAFPITFVSVLDNFMNIFF